MTHLQHHSHPLRHAQPARRRNLRALHIGGLKGSEPRDVWQPALAFALLAIGASFLLGAMLAAVARSGTDVIGRFIPGWPWW